MERTTASPANALSAVWTGIESRSGALRPLADPICKHSTCTRAWSQYNGFRTYDAATGRYLESDPIGQEGSLNLYAYVEGNPVNRSDSSGLDAFRCRKPLDRLGGPTPGSGTRSGPDFSWNPLYHEYICVAGPGGITCGGQTAVGGRPFRAAGLPSDDHFDPNRCEPTGPRDDCFDKCLLAAFTGKRPPYDLFGPGTNCQEWSNDILSLCERICRNRKKQ